MQAVQYAAYGAPPTVVDLAPPACPDDGAVIEVRATGVCRSDWHAWQGHDPVPLPHVPGHELAGVVVEVGPLVTTRAVGERVTRPFHLPNSCRALGPETQVFALGEEVDPTEFVAGEEVVE